MKIWLWLKKISTKWSLSYLRCGSGLNEPQKRWGKAGKAKVFILLWQHLINVRFGGPNASPNRFDHLHYAYATLARKSDSFWPHSVAATIHGHYHGPGRCAPKMKD